MDILISPFWVCSWGAWVKVLLKVICGKVIPGKHSQDLTEIDSSNQRLANTFNLKWQIHKGYIFHHRDLAEALNKPNYIAFFWFGY